MAALAPRPAKKTKKQRGSAAFGGARPRPQAPPRRPGGTAKLPRPATVGGTVRRTAPAPARPLQRRP